MSRALVFIESFVILRKFICMNHLKKFVEIHIIIHTESIFFECYNNSKMTS